MPGFETIRDWLGKVPWVKDHNSLTLLILTAVLLIALWLLLDRILQSFDQPHVYTWLKAHRPSNQFAAWTGLTCGLAALVTSFLPWSRKAALVAPVAKRPLLEPFMDFGIEWAEVAIGKLELRCPSHHAPLFFWPLKAPRDSARVWYTTPGIAGIPQDYQCPYGDDRLCCSTGNEDFRFEERLSIGDVKLRIWARLQGERNTRKN